jgi:hypothetical protein
MVGDILPVAEFRRVLTLSAVKWSMAVGITVNDADRDAIAAYLLALVKGLWRTARRTVTRYCRSLLTGLRQHHAPTPLVFHPVLSAETRKIVASGNWTASTVVNIKNALNAVFS